MELINQHILSEYPEEYRAEGILPLDSLPTLGPCRHWQVDTISEQTCCLRRWPPGMPRKERLQFQQAVLWHAVCEGIDFVPLPIETSSHQGFVTFDGAFWELIPWIDTIEEISSEHFRPGGFPSIERLDGVDHDSGDKPKTEPSEEHFPTSPVPSKTDEHRIYRIASAMMSLAQFHLAVSSFPLPNFPVSISSKIQDQLTQWKYWIGGRFSSLHQALNDPSRCPRLPHAPKLVRSGMRLLEQALPYAGGAMVLLSRASRLSVPIQAIIGNCCLRHLRFDEEGLLGMIDFKKIDVDSVSWDIASLLGSMADSNAELWMLGLRAYQSVRPLSDDEFFLLKAFELSPAFLTGLDFLSNVFLSGLPYTDRQLEEMSRRIDVWNRRFEHENGNRRSA